MNTHPPGGNGGAFSGGTVNGAIAMGVIISGVFNLAEIPIIAIKNLRRKLKYASGSLVARYLKFLAGLSVFYMARVIFYFVIRAQVTAWEPVNFLVKPGPAFLSPPRTPGSSKNKWL